MSDNKKVYVDAVRIKERKTGFGSVIALGVNVNKFIEFLNKHKNDAGYVNIDIWQRKEAGQFGETHYGVLNTYVAQNKSNTPQNNVPQNKTKSSTRQPSTQTSDATDF